MIASDAIMIADPRQGSYGGESFGGGFGLRIPRRDPARAPVLPVCFFV